MLNKISVFIFGILFYLQVPAADNALLEEIVVTADPLSRVDAHFTQPIQVLTKEELQKKSLRNIGETVSQELGVSSSDFGPNVGRPVIRGLSGTRVRVLENGIGTMDASTVNVDHAVSSETVFANQIEIFRGPSTLLYGSGASAGLINIANDRILTYIPEPIEGELSLQYDTVASGRMGAFNLNSGVGNFGFHLDGMVRDTKNYEIPGQAQLESEHHEEDEAEHEEEITGYLPNSFSNTDNLAAGVNYIGERGSVGISIGKYDSDYGLPGGHGHSDEEEGEEEGNESIDMQQTRYDFQATLNNPFSGINQIKTRWGINNYQHDVVVEGHGVETRLKNDEIEGRLELLHDPVGNWNGVLGLQYMDRDFTAEGEEALTPPSTQSSFAIFGLEKSEFSNFHFDIGFRYEHQSANTSELEKQTHNSFSLSGGTRWDYIDGYQLALSATHSQRAPDIQELFTTEPAHPANGTFVISDPDLGTEKSSNFDLSWHKVSGHFSFTASVFYQRIDNFIFLQENDLNNDGFADRVEDHFDGAIDEILDPELEEGLFLVNQTQEDVDLKGFELETVFRLRETEQGNLDLRLWTDYVRGKRNDGVNLPRITPWRFGSSIDYGYKAWLASLTYHHVGSQEHFAPLETRTSGFDMLDFYAAYTFNFSDTNMNIFLKGSNLLDQDARRHTSFLKNSVPLPGRSIILGLGVSF